MPSQHVLENDNLKVVISSLGATILSFKEKKTDSEIVLGFEDESGYLENHDIYMGAIVGRNANRIAEAMFNLNGETYYLDVNNGVNNLHSGSGCFAFKVFEVLESDEKHVKMKYLSPNLEAGFPGNLETIVTYKLEGDSLVLEMEGYSDADTIFNVTNHSYFNLNNCQKDALDHELYIPCEKMNVNDANGVALEELMNVTGTAFDFTVHKTIKEAIEKGHENMIIGIDHNYAFEDRNEKLMCELRNSKLSLKVFSDLPDLQVYTSNYVDTMGREGKYTRYMGVALECQYCPNSINYDKFLKPVLKADEEIKHIIRYEVKGR